MKLSDEQRDKIRHSLGLERDGYPYRNHYCTEAGDPELEALVALGVMKPGALINDGRDQYYHVTPDGAAAVGSALPVD